MYRWSTKRTVKQLERIIMSLGYDRFDDIDIHGYTIRGASSYIHVKPLELTIRVSDEGALDLEREQQNATRM